MVSLVPGMGHGHGSAWNRPESYAFADSIIAGGTPWCVQQGASVSNGIAEVTFQSTKVLDDAVLISTIFGGLTSERVWNETPATLVDNGGGSYTLSATLPEYTTAWFINGHSGSLVVTSDFIETGVVPSNIVYDTTSNWSSQTVNPNDTVTVKSGATVTVDQDDEALMLTITEAAALQQDQNVTLAIAGAVEVDSGALNQSGGTIRAGALTVNANGAMNLTGGELMLSEEVDAVDISNGGVVAINGTTLSKDLLGPATNNFSLGTSGQASGLVQVQGGGLQITNGIVYGVINQYAQLEVSGGDVDLWAQTRTHNEIKVIGEAASINIGWLGTQSGSSFVFELDASGISPVQVAAWASLGNASLTVDGASYTGGPASMVLFDAGNLVQLVPAGNIAMSGFVENGLTATVIQDQALHEVRLEITEYVPDPVVYDTSANWFSKTVNDGDEVIIRNDATVTAEVMPVAFSNLIVNGSFEADVIAPSEFSVRSAGSGGLSGWVISDTAVVLIDSFDNFDAWAEPAEASDGEQFLQLQTHTDGGGIGTISQTFATTVGQTYTLSFDYSGIYPSSTDSSLSYAVDGHVRTLNMNISGNQLPWATETFQFAAVDPLTTVSFTGEFEAGFWGSSIDNVRVSASALSSDTADTLIVNDDDSPITATLDIHDDEFNLTVSTAIELGAGTGAGMVNQLAGTVTTEDLTVNSSGSGDWSTYTLSGGLLDCRGTLNIEANGKLVQSGGILKVDSDGDGGTGPVINIAAGGVLEISGGTLTQTVSGRVNNDGVLRVVGDDASIAFRQYWYDCVGTIEFILNATGVSTVTNTSWGQLENSTFKVDGADYAGGPANIVLYSGTYHATAVTALGSLSVTNLGVEGVDYTVEEVLDPYHKITLNILTSHVPVGYGVWADDYTLSGADTNLNADVDQDGLNNLTEYALGGNPTNDDAAAVSPMAFVAEDTGADWFYYIHNERTDDPVLKYSVGTSTVLGGTPTWNTNDVVIVGASVAVDHVKSVTNRTAVSEANKFIRLRIEYD
jgi:hypothetical protein